MARRLLTRDGTLVLNNGNLNSRWLASLPRMAAAMVSSPFVSQKLGLNVQKWSQEDLVELGRMVEAGQVSPMIDRTHGLSETADALEYVGRGHARGKVVVAI